MKREQLDFLKKLIEAPSPSGYEWPAQKVYRDYLKGYVDEIKTDVMGGVMAIKNPNGNPRVMLAGHVDEVGMIVHYIDEQGYLYFKEIGGIDPVVLPGTRVILHTENEPVVGVIGRKAIHVLEEEEKKGTTKISDLWIDIGAKNQKEAESLVKLGDPATVSYSFEMLGKDMATSRAFDDKVGVFVIAEVAKELAKEKIKAALFATSTTQEEVGLRGARATAYGINAEVGIAVDVTHGNDFPGSSKQKHGSVEVGKGPVLTRGANVTPAVEKMLISLAEKNKIPYQIEAHGCGTGTDANIMQMTRAGMATGLVSIPLRYMHTPSEVVSLTDIENTVKLVKCFVKDLKPGINWIP